MVSLGCPHSRMTAIHEPAAGRKERITMKVAKINRNTPYGPRTSLRVAFVSLLICAAWPALGSAQLAQSVSTNPPIVYVSNGGGGDGPFEYIKQYWFGPPTFPIHAHSVGLTAYRLRVNCP